MNHPRGERGVPDSPERFVQPAPSPVDLGQQNGLSQETSGGAQASEKGNKHSGERVYPSVGFQEPISVEEESKIRKERREAEERRERLHYERRRAAALESVRLPAWLVALLWWTAVPVALVLFVLVLSWSMWLSVTAQQFPAPVQWMLVALEMLVAVGIAVSGIKLGRLLLKLRKTPNIPIKALAVLSQRQQLRYDIEGNHLREARMELHGYLASSPLGIASEQQRKTLSVLGFSDDDFLRLEATRKTLLDPQLRLGPSDWLRRYYTDFQQVLDARAADRVAYYMKRVAAMTALSPRKAFLDTLIVGYYSTIMVSDLMRIYGLTPAPSASALIVARMSFNTFVAGSLDGAVDQVQQYLEVKNVAGVDNMLAAVDHGVTAMLGTIAKKCAEAVTNALLMRRLGSATIRSLQPVSPDSLEALVES